MDILKRNNNTLQNPAVRASLLIGLITLTAAFVVAFFEGAVNEQFTSFWDAVWWVLVTISTVGYGDKVPVTPEGRLVAIVIMLLGVALLSIVTATISSIFVTKKIREGKGLEDIKLKNHLVICGWNSRVEQILNTFERAKSAQRAVVLINQLSEEEITDVLSRFATVEVKFVRGDFTREIILNRANIKNASAAIVLPDSSSGLNPTDERTILATLSIKAINPNIKVYAHILDKENLSHLKKAHADEVIVSDAYSGFLLANHVLAPGVPQLLEQLFSEKSPYTIKRHPLPESLIGKTYGELAADYQQNNTGILIGLGQIKEPFKISDLMSSDYSYLDEFILRKFQESGRGPEGEQIKIFINPEKDVVLTQNDFYIAIESDPS